jgi:hypothetical protein
MFDHNTIRIILADNDSRPWSRLSDLGSDEVFEIYVTDRAESEQLASDLGQMGLNVAVCHGTALSAGTPDFWVVVGRLADLATLALPAIHLFLKSEEGKRLRAFLSRSRGRKELHPAFCFEALVEWCDQNFGHVGTDGNPAWRFDPDLIRARHLAPGLVALEVHEEISGRVLLLASDGEKVEWLSDRVQSGPTP